MAPAPATLIPRQHLAELNALRDGPAVLRLSSHLGLIVMAGWVWRLPHWPLPVRLLGLALSGVGLATCFAPLHECCHRTAFRSKQLNDAVAWLMGLLSFYNATFYRRYHQWHHRYTHQPGLDPELDDPVPTSLGAYVRELSGWNWWVAKVSGYGRLLWGDLSAMPYLNPEVSVQVRRSVRLQFGVYGLLVLLSLIAANGFVMWSWVVPLAVGQPLLRALLLAEHTGCAYGADPLDNTRTTLTTAPVRWLMWNMPFHAEHHLYASLPFHALPTAHAW
ncbi:MAG: fatty acid desaturase, partial [Cyanobacteria bacterium K_DeepCast_35m_m2_023]|nr:fatty acid desaturase [Cyanobacteria bacterium K_DeepCast_35m_m2_023]